MRFDAFVGEPGPRRVPIVAVFGSRKPEWTLPLAVAIGRQLALRDCIALTGADRKTDPKNAKTVKERAIDGVEAEHNASRHVGPWVGVARDETTLDPELDDDGRWIVLHPGFNHKRNYLEAQMCDVAIALEGGPGTESEAVFTLAAGKPVILVTEYLRPRELPHHGTPERTDLEPLVDRAREAAKARPEIANTYLDRQLRRESLIEALEERIGMAPDASPVLYRRVPHTTSGAEIVGAALDLMMSLPQGGPPGLPVFDGQQNETKEAYDSWLERLLETIMPGVVR